MSATLISKFWNDFHKVTSNFEKDGLIFATFVIDTTKQIAEINGESQLKSLLFESAPNITHIWYQNRKKHESNIREPKPPGATHWLPFIPPGGIAQMSYVTLEMYWSTVMRTLLADRESSWI